MSLSEDPLAQVVHIKNKIFAGSHAVWPRIESTTASYPRGCHVDTWCREICTCSQSLDLLNFHFDLWLRAFLIFDQWLIDGFSVNFGLDIFTFWLLTWYKFDHWLTLLNVHMWSGSEWEGSKAMSLNFEFSAPF